MNPQVIRVDGDELIDLIDELMAAHQVVGWVRLVFQDGGIKVAHGQGTWSLEFGQEIDR